MKQSHTAKGASNFIQDLFLILKSHLSGDEKVRTVSITFDTEQKTEPGQIVSGKIPIVFSKVSGQTGQTKSPEILSQLMNKTIGKSYPPKQILSRKHVKTLYLKQNDFSKQKNNVPVELNPHSEGTLSIREREIIEILAEGNSHKMIASRLGISINTVRNHFRKIHFKLHVHSNTEVLLKALKSGIISAKQLSVLFYLILNSFSEWLFSAVKFFPDFG